MASEADPTFDIISELPDDKVTSDPNFVLANTNAELSDAAISAIAALLLDAAASEKAVEQETEAGE